MVLVWPLRAIVFQCLFLLIAIALEGWSLRRYLRLPYKDSIKYSATLNLLSTVSGWVAFFGLETLVPTDVKLSLILFDQWYGDIATLIILAGFATFFLTVAVELKGLQLLQTLLEVPPQAVVDIKSRRSSGLRDLRTSTGSSNNPAYAVLVANAMSYSAILILSVVLRLLAADALSL